MIYKNNYSVFLVALAISGLISITGCSDDNDLIDDDFICGSDIIFTYRGEQVAYGTMERGGLCWMDRNLGADPLPFVPAEDATGNTDERLYGDLFQWGRLDDGHQDRQSNITTGLSNGDVPGHGDFIVVTSEPYDWRASHNHNLWQGVNGKNNPCPPGWRLPDVIELGAERQSWTTNNDIGAYDSPLKWPLGGGRSYTDGMLGMVENFGFVWSSSVGPDVSSYLFYYDALALTGSDYRAGGMSVRCVRNLE